MEYSENIRAFLAAHGMEPESIDLRKACALFKDEMRRGLAGESSSLKMIPTYLRAGSSLPAGRPVAVIDAGGTNFRTALVSYAADGFSVSRLSVCEMPGVRSPVEWDDFIDFTAERIIPLLDRTDTVGFCFSYPTLETEDLDGYVLSLTKQVRISGFEGRPVCGCLRGRLAESGFEKIKTVLLNDTPAVLLSGSSLLGSGGYDSLIGLISGTGTNSCCVLPCSAVTKEHGAFEGDMLINLESGAFSGFPRGDFDRELDASTCDPGAYLHEKMTSGAYVGELCRITLSAAAAEGLFSADGADALMSLEKFSSEDADNAALGEIPFLHDGEDLKTASQLCRAVFDRSARCVCSNLSAILSFTGAGRDGGTACICVDGSMYKRSRSFRPLLAGYMDSFASGVLGHKSAFKTFDNATILGTAAAALLNR